jgi:hypothetical protein
MLITYRLQGFLDLTVQRSGFDGDDLGGRIGVVGDGRTALGAKDTMHGFARATRACPALGGTLHGELVLGHDGDEGWENPDLVRSDPHRYLGGCIITVGRPALTLAVIAVIVPRDQGLLNIDAVRHSFAEAVASENHVGGIINIEVDRLAREGSQGAQWK